MPPGVVNDPFHQGELISSQLKSCGNSLSCDYDFDDLITSQICTCHNSIAVMTYAKYWPDWIIIFRVRAIWLFQDLHYELIIPLWNGSRGVQRRNPPSCTNDHQSSRMSFQPGIKSAERETSLTRISNVELYKVLYISIFLVPTL